mmetsp:Transcript_51554/g.164878  ORF Transcript_51554/g.164878 Transcript_51554/m.164878 type:complete len:257 (-) Transcript_51554:755-1525(-)
MRSLGQPPKSRRAGSGPLSCRSTTCRGLRRRRNRRRRIFPSCGPLLEFRKTSSGRCPAGGSAISYRPGSYASSSSRAPSSGASPPRCPAVLLPLPLPPRRRMDPTALWTAETPLLRTRPGERAAAASLSPSSSSASPATDPRLRPPARGSRTRTQVGGRTRRPHGPMLHVSQPAAGAGPAASPLSLLVLLRGLSGGPARSTVDLDRVLDPLVILGGSSPPPPCMRRWQSTCTTAWHHTQRHTGWMERRVPPQGASQ